MSFRKIVSFLAAVALVAFAAFNAPITVSAAVEDSVKLSDDLETGYTVGGRISDSSKYSAGSTADGVWGELVVRENANGNVGSIRIAEEEGNKVIEFYSEGGLVSDATPRLQKHFVPSESDTHKILLSFSAKKVSTIDEFYVIVSAGGVTNERAMCLKGVNALKGNETGAVNIGANSWHKYMLLIDLDNWTSTLYVDGNMIFSDGPMGGTARPANYSRITVGFSNKIKMATSGQSSLLDDITITEYKGEYSVQVIDAGADYVVLNSSAPIPIEGNITGIAAATGQGSTVTASECEYISNDTLKVKISFDGTLSPGTDYTLDLSGVADVFGRTKETVVSFKTKERGFYASLPTLHRGGGLINELESGSLTAQADVENTLEQAKEALLLNILYDENGTVEDIASSRQSIPAGGKATLVTSAVNVTDTDGRTLKLFLFDVTTGFVPLTDAVQYGVGTPDTPASAAREGIPGIRKTGIVDLDAQTAEIYVTLANAAPGQRVGVLVTDAESGSDIEYYNEGVSNANGVYVVTFGLTAEKKYDVLVVSGNQNYTASFYYVTETTANIALTAVNAASDVNSLLAALQNQGQNLMLDLDYFDSLSDTLQKSIVSIMLGFKNSAGGAFASPTAASEAYLRAEALKRIELAENTTELAGIINENASLLDFHTYDTYRNVLTGEGRDIVNNKMLNAAAVTGIDLIDFFNEKVILAGVFKANQWADVRTIFTRHYDIIGLPGQAVAAADSSVFKSLSGEDYFNLAALKSAFEAATVVKTKPSGGGGGGGTRITTDISPPAATPQPEIAPPAKAAEYTDLDSVPWAKESISELSRLGIVQGKGDGKFEPDAFVTREEIVKMLINSLGLLIEDAASDFKDVSKDAWYYPFVASANQLGITRGIGDGCFGTGQSVTRQDMAVMIYATAKLAGVDFEEADETPFSDSGAIADYAKESISALYKAQIISGMDDNRFAPEEFCTRAQAAKVIHGVLRLKP